MSLSGLFRRFYSTPPSKAASSALVSSTPRAVRIRRKRFPEALAETSEDSVLSDVERTTYNRNRARGELTTKGPDGFYELSEEEWLDRTNSQRRRVRGTKRPSTESEGTSIEEAQVVGQRIYLPNIIFRLVRNNTPLGEPYNPFEATFRIPQSLTKLDIRGYLLSMYGVRTTYIRTDNRIADINRSSSTRSLGRWKSDIKTYKRAVVGLEEPFYFPRAREDMNPQERAELDEFINRKFQREAIQKMRANFSMRAFRPRGYRNTDGHVHLRGKIIRKVMEQKMAREGAVANAVEDVLGDAGIMRQVSTVRST